MSTATTTTAASFFVLLVSSTTGALRYTRGNSFVTRGAATFEASQSNKLTEHFRAQGWDESYKVFSADELNALMALGTCIGEAY